MNLDGFGFAKNKKRGQCKVFSSEALHRFLNDHALTHVIRAHQVQEAGIRVSGAGDIRTPRMRPSASVLSASVTVTRLRLRLFQLRYNTHLLTVFSSSKYCGGTNGAACVLAYDGKLNVLRVARQAEAEKEQSATTKKTPRKT